MISAMRIKRICEYCGKEWEARKTTSKTCSTDCAKKNYKAKQREAKIEASNKETVQIKIKPLTEIRAKEFLTVKDVSKLLNFSIRTTYRLIELGEIKAVNLSERKTLVRRSDIDKLFS